MPKKNRKVGFTVAHSAKRQGASWDGAQEHELSRGWTTRVVRELQRRGVEAVICPDGGLRDKVTALNKEKCGLVLEIHFNACGGCGAKGCETLYYPGSKKGKKAAEIVQKHLVPAMKTKDRGAKEGWYRQDHPGQVDYAGDVEGDEKVLYFLQKTKCTALILEPEFIEHHAQFRAARPDAVKAIADAIEEIIA